MSVTYRRTDEGFHFFEAGEDPFNLVLIINPVGTISFDASTRELLSSLPGFSHRYLPDLVSMMQQAHNIVEAQDRRNP